jgi:uncharacterized protein YegJ (DUF2314 family)
MWKRIKYLLILTALVTCCRGKAGGFVRDAVRPAGADDPALAEIAEQARQTLPEFLMRLQRPGKGERDFMVKVPFEVPAGNGVAREFIWLAGIRYKDGLYYGTAVNRPLYIEGLEEGGAASFHAGDIADWMYFRDGKIVGGRSIKYLIETTPEIDRTGDMEYLLNLFELE